MKYFKTRYIYNNSLNEWCVEVAPPHSGYLKRYRAQVFRWTYDKIVKRFLRQLAKSMVGLYNSGETRTVNFSLPLNLGANGFYGSGGWFRAERAIKEFLIWNRGLNESSVWINQQKRFVQSCTNRIYHVTACLWSDNLVQAQPIVANAWMACRIGLDAMQTAQLACG